MTAAVSAPGGLLRDDAVRTLQGWAPPDDQQARLATAYLDLLANHHDAALRTCLPAHLTASAMVLDHTGRRVLLTLHRKGSFWGQLGGHCDPQDTTLAGAALREATEESGLTGLRLLTDGPVDLDRHALSAAFGSCGEHLDVRYAVMAPPDTAPVRSAESRDLAWFPADALPPGAVDDLRRLVDRARAAWSSALPAPGRSAPSQPAGPSSSSDNPSSAVADTPSR